MGTVRPFTPEKLVVAVLLSTRELESAVHQALEAAWGPVDYRSAFVPFRYTPYYEAEMGTELERVFYSLRRLVDPQRLAEVKLATNALEARLSRSGRRRANLDPGLLCCSRFVLASTKDSSHRVPLGRGIYAEVTLMYERGEFRPVEWTYPDYRDHTYRSILAHIRELYREQLKAGRSDPRSLSE